MNPRYAGALSSDRLNVQFEVNYHLKNMRLLSMYFDVILILTGNILNFTTFTSKEIITRVVAHPDFQYMLNAGVICICGWGSKTATGMAENQIGYSEIYRPELKTKEYKTQYLSACFSAETVYREEGVGESDLIDSFLFRLNNFPCDLSDNDKNTVANISYAAQDEAGHLGTLNFFPRVDHYFTGNVKRRQIYDLFFSTWQEYSAKNYSTVFSYENFARPIDIWRQINVPGDMDRQVLAVALSPQVFELFLGRYFSVNDLAKILSLPIEKFLTLRNGDRHRFGVAYHALVYNVSTILVKTCIIHFGNYGLEKQKEWLDVFKELEQKHPEKFDFVSFFSFLSAVATTTLVIPGIGSLIRLGLLPFKEQLNQYASKLARKARKSELDFYIYKIKKEI